MTEKEQFKTYLPRARAEDVRQLDESNSQVVDDALEMYLRAHGRLSIQDIKDDVREIDKEIQAVREQALQDIQRLQERRDELTATLERKEAREELVEDTVREIAEGLAANPGRNISGFREQVEWLVGQPGITDLGDVVERVQLEINTSGLVANSEQLSPMMSGSGVGGVVADGGSQGVDVDGYGSWSGLSEDGDTDE